MLVKELTAVIDNETEFAVDVGGVDTRFYDARSLEEAIGNAEISYIGLEETWGEVYVRVEVI